MVISTLVARARERAEAMRAREVQTASLYYLSRDLAAAADINAVLKAVVRNIEESLNAEVVILLPEGERLDILAASEGLTLDLKEQAVADWAFRNQSAGRARHRNPGLRRPALSAPADPGQRAGGPGGQTGRGR